MEDYEVVGIDMSENSLIHYALFSNCDPTTIEIDVKETK